MALYENVRIVLVLHRHSVGTALVLRWWPIGIAQIGNCVLHRYCIGAMLILPFDGTSAAVRLHWYDTHTTSFTPPHVYNTGAVIVRQGAARVRRWSCMITILVMCCKCSLIREIPTRYCSSSFPVWCLRSTNVVPAWCPVKHQNSTGVVPAWYLCSPRVQPGDQCSTSAMPRFVQVRFREARLDTKFRTTLALDLAIHPDEARIDHQRLPRRVDPKAFPSSTRRPAHDSVNLPSVAKIAPARCFNSVLPNVFYRHAQLAVSRIGRFDIRADPFGGSFPRNCI